VTLGAGGTAFPQEKKNKQAEQQCYKVSTAPLSLDKQQQQRPFNGL